MAFVPLPSVPDLDLASGYVPVEVIPAADRDPNAGIWTRALLGFLGNAAGSAVDYGMKDAFAPDYYEQMKAAGFIPDAEGEPYEVDATMAGVLSDKYLRGQAETGLNTRFDKEQDLRANMGVLDNIYKLATDPWADPETRKAAQAQADALVRSMQSQGYLEGFQQPQINMIPQDKRAQLKALGMTDEQIDRFLGLDTKSIYTPGELEQQAKLKAGAGIPEPGSAGALGQSSFGQYLKNVGLLPGWGVGSPLPTPGRFAETWGIGARRIGHDLTDIFDRFMGATERFNLDPYQSR